MCDPQVQQLLEDILESGITPEEACADHPELLWEVRERLRRCREIDAEVEAMFPPSGDMQDGGAGIVSRPSGELPQVPGYEIESVLGRGGMGVVYQAVQLKLNRRVALKMVLVGAHARRSELVRFMREAQDVASLRHPNVVQVYDVGELDGLPYFTMEYVDGGTLANRLAGAPQPARDAAEMVATLASAVQAAHEAGIVHRDLKPANVLLAAGGAPKIADFGLASHFDDGERRLTLSGARVGTPSYMAPEQAAGNASAVGPAADVYSLGAMLYELLTGRPPFRAETASATVQQVIHDEPAPPSRLNAKVPRDLETICLKCLEKAPAKRYATAAALADDLRRFGLGEPIAARPAGRAARAIKWARRRPATATSLVTGAVTAFTLIGVAAWIVTDRVATARAVSGELDAAVQHQQSAAWAEADAALTRARLRLGSRGPADLRDRLQRVVHDSEFVPRLEAIRTARAFNQGNILAFADADRTYEAAFRQLGFGVGDAPADEAGGRIGLLPIRLALIDALYDWSFCTADKGRVKWLREAAGAADPDPTGWRAELLSPVKTQEAVVKLASNPAIDRQPVSLLLVASKIVTDAGRDPSPLLLRANRSHPDDFWLNLSLGDEMSRVANHSEAIRYFQVALAVRPDSGVGHFNLGIALAAANRPLEAVDEYREALRVGGESSAVRVNLAVALSMTGRHEDACREFDVALKQLPEHGPRMARYDGAYAYSLMGVGRDADAVRWAIRAASKEPWLAVGPTPAHAVLVHARRWDEILSAWRTWLEGEAGANHESWRGYAEFAMFCGDLDEHHRASREQLDRFGNVLDPPVGEGIARACLLGEPPEDVLRRSTALVDRILADEKLERTWRYPYFMLVKALAEYRAGRNESALAMLDGPAVGALEPARRLVAALALARLGNSKIAMSNLALGVLAFDWSPSHADSREAWMFHVLRREAERAILPELPRFLAGKYEPSDDLERVAMSAECQFRELHAARARLLARVVESGPELAARFRGLAVFPAAMAGCGLGKDTPALSDTEREQWRTRARQWVREELASAAAGGAEQKVSMAKTALASWLAAPELACVRDPAALARLPMAERQEWAGLWEQARKLGPALPSGRNR